MKWIVTVSTLLHLLVDGLSVCCLYMAVGVGSGSLVDSFMLAFVTYNILAFLSQPLTGYMADRLKGGVTILLVASLLLMSVAVATTMAADDGGWHGQWVMLTVALLLGLGNSLFHVWGGKVVAVFTGNDMRALGLFVSTGALGLALGGVYASWHLLTAMLMLMAVLVIATAVGVRHKDEVLWQSVAKPGRKRIVPMSVRWVTAVVTLPLLMFFVMGRSAVSQAFASAFGDDALWVLVIAVVAMAGKMAGGWVGRALGAIPALTLMAAAALTCLIVVAVMDGTMVPWRLAGLFFANLTMPVTLSLANRAMPEREGLSFGLLAAALVPGYVLVFLI